MSNNNSPIKISTYTNSIGQVHNKSFDKTSHEQVKIFKNRQPYCHYHTITLCHVQAIEFSCLLIW